MTCYTVPLSRHRDSFFCKDCRRPPPRPGLGVRPGLVARFGLRDGKVRLAECAFLDVCVLVRACMRACVCVCARRQVVGWMPCVRTPVEKSLGSGMRCHQMGMAAGPHANRPSTACRFLLLALMSLPATHCSAQVCRTAAHIDSLWAAPAALAPTPCRQAEC